MPPAKGSKRHENSGRKKGTPNKRSWDIVRLFERAGFDPAAKLIQLTLDAELAHKELGIGHENSPAYLATASKNCAELCKFVYPTRKAVDLTTGGEKVHISFSDFVRDAVAKKDFEPSDKK